MKKAVLLIGLVSFFVLVCGCSNSQYSIEKKYWHIKKQANKIFSNPYGSPPEELKKAVLKLDKFTSRYPKSILALDAQLTIARLYILRKESSQSPEEAANYKAKAKEILERLIAQYPQTRLAKAAKMLSKELDKNE